MRYVPECSITFKRKNAANSLDIIKSKKKSCTAYGENAPSEDFAENVAEYAMNKVVFTKLFPNRAAYLSKIIQ